MASDLPGVFFRPDRGWTPRVRGLAGAQIHGDERMAILIVNGMDGDEMASTLVGMAGLVVSLLLLTPWADGITDDDEVARRWNESTARLVAELSGYSVDDGDP